MLEQQEESSLSARLDRDGYSVVAGVMSAAQCHALARELVSVGGVAEPRRRAGVRDLLAKSPDVREVLRADTIRRLVRRSLSESAFAVRAILFDKTAVSNWHVAWHQDLTVAVSSRVGSLQSFGPWSVKAGITHVQPPVWVLERMVTIRLHLDPCDSSNGPLEVLPGSHRAGISKQRPEGLAPTICTVPQGGALVMRPLLWHASGKAESPGHRRVLHIEYADIELPDPLDWHERHGVGS